MREAGKNFPYVGPPPPIIIDARTGAAPAFMGLSSTTLPRD
jgi:hypothetical protein